VGVVTTSEMARRDAEAAPDLHRFVAEGRIGAVAPRFQVIYSEYSQRKTLTVDAPEILKQMREDRVDVAVLTAV